MESFFPQRFNDVSSVNILSDLKRQSLKIIERINADLNGDHSKSEKIQKTIDSIESYLISLNPPKDFSSSEDNVIQNIDKSFAFLCTSMEELGIIKPHLLSVFDFNAKIEYFKSKHQKKPPE